MSQLTDEELDYICHNYRELLPSLTDVYLQAKHRAVLGEQDELSAMSWSKVKECERAAAAVAYENHRREIHFERCPKCRKLAATPRAEQCLECGHEWRGQNPRRIC
jgi:hypothetical protein